ncbi:hypothetical protein [Chitinophaga varians]|uniref:hypothetical protein n=1 Tax=Chitinophaga varians TaxID=2202339 RepID=UPI00165FBD72|nr:hypothetical protein [Chitinophaga varians]MBC9909140.1 hypothetical protein [Chitinophaga varians]
MNWSNFQPYGQDPKDAFEILCSKLYHNYLKRQYGKQLTKFRVINGAGGDGGVEAYAQLDNADTMAMQAKWFLKSMKTPQLNQIEDSIREALHLRPQITKYTICIPHRIWSVKFGRGKNGEGKKPTMNHEEILVEKFEARIKQTYPALELIWWFEERLEDEIMQPENEGVHKFFFQVEVITFKKLIDSFEKQKHGWLQGRYIPQLHNTGVIQREIRNLTFSKASQIRLLGDLNEIMRPVVQVDRLIKKIGFSPTLDASLVSHLEALSNYLIVIKKMVEYTSETIREGSSILNERIEYPPIDLQGLMEELEKLPNSDFYHPIKQMLPYALKDLLLITTGNLLENIWAETRQSVLLVLGNAGSGKTHALANTVERHLFSGAPALIIQAKGSSCQSWPELLRNALDLPTWNEDEILTALELIALRKEATVLKTIVTEKNIDLANEYFTNGSKVIITIDGMEEDIHNWNIWYERMGESLYIIQRFPSVRFVFTARPYFEDSTKIPNGKEFKRLVLPEEGDVSVKMVASQYFTHYNIEIESLDRVRGIDSLFALKLFCDLYHDRHLGDTDEIETAEEKLLLKKVDKINTEFISTLSHSPGKSHNPVLEAVRHIADEFYKVPELEQKKLLQALSSSLNYLSFGEISRLLDHLVAHGLLNEETISDFSPYSSLVTRYTLSYQSIMELIMSDKIYQELKLQDKPIFPVFLLETSSVSDRQPTHLNSYDMTLDKGKSLINYRIVQNVVNKFLQDEDKIIGRQGFLSDGLSEEMILTLQMGALMNSNENIVAKYKPKLKKQFIEDRKLRFKIFSKLILPAGQRSKSPFGANFLHEILASQPSAFARDQIWMGQDQYSVASDGRGIGIFNDEFHLHTALLTIGSYHLTLSPIALHDEMPLIYAWALSTLDQRIRNRLTKALCEWAIKQPYEFILLLEKLFMEADPQIQEDLASIAMGLAGKIDHCDEILRDLANWAFANIFMSSTNHRNIIVRHGFRAVIERAYQYGLVSEDYLKRCHPQMLQFIVPIPLDYDALTVQTEEFYPIVHDLAWYVIKEVDDNFLRLANSGSNKSAIDAFYQAFHEQAKDSPVNSHNWTKAAAIAYMKSLGFNRKVGNTITEATHGMKSTIYTCEEKYTWLAVHYLKGYLSDYLPYVPNQSGNETRLIGYHQIESIPNPAELISFDSSLLFRSVPIALNGLVIKETLTPELDMTLPVDKAIIQAITLEPDLDPVNWLEYASDDLGVKDVEDEWLAFYNYTNTTDSQKSMDTSLAGRAGIIEKGQVSCLMESIMTPDAQFNLLNNLNRLDAFPDTDSYSNPTDIVWMDWIGEVENELSYFLPDGQEKFIFSTITSVTTMRSGEEVSLKIPSKFIRNLLGIVSMEENCFFNAMGEVIAFYQDCGQTPKGGQQLLLVKKTLLLEALNSRNLELIWFVELFKRERIPYLKSLNRENFCRRCRKYFTWFENGSIVWRKVWDAEACN